MKRNQLSIGDQLQGLLLAVFCFVFILPGLFANSNPLIERSQELLSPEVKAMQAEQREREEARRLIREYLDSLPD